MTQLAIWENLANHAIPKGSRSPVEFSLQHYEVPLSLLSADLDADLDPEVRDALIFKRRGESYVRWIINPEDTRYHQEIAKLLLSHGLDARPKTYFRAYRTASRSLLILDPTTGAQFSAKVSTNQTPGGWSNKPQVASWTRYTREFSRYVSRLTQTQGLRSAQSMPEPAAFTLDSINQGLVVRSLEGLLQGDYLYLPVFSALHDEVGVEIAAKNGSTDPAEFWNAHANRAVARALAEYTARTGMVFAGAHAQNLLIELDAQMKPTGRIVIRDGSDGVLVRELVQALGGKSLIEHLPKEDIKELDWSLRYLLFHGSRAPQWLSAEWRKLWENDYFETFERTFSEFAGAGTQKLDPRGRFRNGEIAVSHYHLNDRLKDSWLRTVAAGQSVGRCVEAGVEKLLGRLHP